MTKKYKVINIEIELSENNQDNKHSINELTTKIINQVSKTIANKIKWHNLVLNKKVSLDKITINTFPNETK